MSYAYILSRRTSDDPLYSAYPSPYHRLSPVAFTLFTPIHTPFSRISLPPSSQESDGKAPAAVMVAVVIAESRASEGAGAGEGGWAEAGFTHDSLYHMREVTLSFRLLPHTIEGRGMRTSAKPRLHCPSLTRMSPMVNQ